MKLSHWKELNHKRIYTNEKKVTFVKLKNLPQIFLRWSGIRPKCTRSFTLLKQNEHSVCTFVTCYVHFLKTTYFRNLWHQLDSRAWLYSRLGEWRLPCVDYLPVIKEQTYKSSITFLFLKSTVKVKMFMTNKFLIFLSQQNKTSVLNDFLLS